MAFYVIIDYQQLTTILPIKTDKNPLNIKRFARHLLVNSQNPLFIGFLRVFLFSNLNICSAFVAH